MEINQAKIITKKIQQGRISNSHQISPWQHEKQQLSIFNSHQRYIEKIAKHRKISARLNKPQQINQQTKLKRNTHKQRIRSQVSMNSFRQLHNNSSRQQQTKISGQQQTNNYKLIKTNSQSTMRKTSLKNLNKINSNTYLFDHDLLNAIGNYEKAEAIIGRIIQKKKSYNNPDRFYGTLTRKSSEILPANKCIEKQNKIKLKFNEKINIIGLNSKNFNSLKNEEVVGEKKINNKNSNTDKQTASQKLYVSMSSRRKKLEQSKFSTTKIGSKQFSKHILDKIYKNM